MQGNGGSGNESTSTGAPQGATEEDLAHIFRESLESR